jgi:hypothetical protein
MKPLKNLGIPHPQLGESEVSERIRVIGRIGQRLPAEADSCEDKKEAGRKDSRGGQELDCHVFDQGDWFIADLALRYHLPHRGHPRLRREDYAGRRWAGMALVGHAGIKSSPGTPDHGEASEGRPRLS